MITLTYQSTTIELSDRLQWVNEMSWSNVDQEVSYATDGTLVIDESVKQSGREIELNGVETEAWIDRATCLQCMAWRELPAARFTLVLRGVARTVMFHRAKGGFDAAPIHKLLDDQITVELLYRPQFWFLEVEE